MSTKQIIRILNFEPSLSATGWSVTDYNVSTGKVVVNRFGCIRPLPHMAKPVYREEVERFGKRLISLELLRISIIDLLKTFNPEYITVQEAEFDPRRPNAYASLLHWHCAVSLLCYQEFRMPIYRITGKTAILCVSGYTGKMSIQEAIHSNDHISFKQKKQAELITEPESTSIAMGYFFVKEQLPGILAHQANSPITQQGSSS